MAWCKLLHLSERPFPRLTNEGNDIARPPRTVVHSKREARRVLSAGSDVERVSDDDDDGDGSMVMSGQIKTPRD